MPTIKHVEREVSWWQLLCLLMIFYVIVSDVGRDHLTVEVVDCQKAAPKGDV